MGLLAAPGQAAQIGARALFDAADVAQQRHKPDEALEIYRTLEQSPNVAIRSEARFRHAKLLVRLGRLAEAATLYRVILDEQSDAQPAHLELAAVLAQMGNISAARRELRQAQAGPLPPEIAQVVRQYVVALRSRKPWGGSLDLALAPDSNINRATNAATLDTVIAPLTLSDDARQQSGVGLRQSSQVYGRIDLDTTVTIVPRLSTQAVLYRASQFNDIAGSAQVGLEWRPGADRISPAVGQTWRWFGGRLYARTQSVSLDWLHPMGKRTQLNATGSVNRVRHHANPLQDGTIYTASISYERALSTRSGISLMLSVNRQTARDAGYATASGMIGGSVWRELGKTTLFASGNAGRLEADARLGLFLDSRREWYLRAGAGAVFRQVQLAGFSPVVRVAYDRNWSSVGLYDFRRATSDVGITRAF